MVDPRAQDETNPRVERSAPALRVGRFAVWPALDEIDGGEGPIKLEPRTMKLLLALADRAGEVVAIDQLLDTVWAGVIVTPNSVYQSVAQLRRLLGDDADRPQYIATVQRKGYRMLATVQRLPPAGAAPAAVAAPEVVTPEHGGAAGARAMRRSVVPALSRRFAVRAAAAALVLGGTGIAAWLLRRPAPPTAASPLRLVVLPFTDLSQGGVDAALATGLALEVAGLLERYAELRVTAPASMLQLQPVAAAMPELAARLNVTHLLSAQLFRSRERVRLTVRLEALADQRLLWQDAVEQPIDALGALPISVAEGVLRSLGLPAAAGPTAPPLAAYELFLLGMHAVRERNAEGVRRARGYFERSIDADPRFARGYAGLGMAWIAQRDFGFGIGYAEALARAQPLLEKALALDPNCVEALSWMGALYADGGQTDDARHLLKRALELAPSHSQAHFSLGLAELTDGWALRALEHFRRTAELDPLSATVLVRLGNAATDGGLHDEALRYHARALAIAPRFPNGQSGIGIVGYARGRLDDAVRAYRLALEADSRRPFLWWQLAWLQLDLERADDARNSFAQAAVLLSQPTGPQLDGLHAELLGEGARSVSRALAAFAVDGLSPWDAYNRIWLGSLAGAAPDPATVERVAAVLLTARAGRRHGWELFSGRLPEVDLAVLFAEVGAQPRAMELLESAATSALVFEERGNVWHAVDWQLGRIAAVRGQRVAAFERLERAVERGWRRGWLARIDPALRPLRGEPRWSALLARIDATVAEQRSRL